MFFAVCRGKVSEGIDFSDADSRAVCVVGIPYPPLADVRICLKRLYINELAADDKTAQSSDEWYVTEGYRAVNQALGRVIRHVNDFGVVALLDERFAGVKKEYFPSWLRSSLRVFDCGSEFVSETKNFFKIRKLDVKKWPEDVMKNGSGVSGTLVRNRSAAVMSTEHRRGCEMDYGLYTLQPQCSKIGAKNDKQLCGETRSSLLSICDADELSRTKPNAPETFDLSTGSEPHMNQMNHQPLRKKLKLTRGPVEEQTSEGTLQSPVCVVPPSDLRAATLLRPNEYFEMVTRINKHKQIGAFLKQFSMNSKPLAEILTGLEELLLPRYPEAFLGASCLLEKQEHKDLLYRRAAERGLKFDS